MSRGDSDHALPPNASGAPTRSSDVHEMTSIAVISSVAGAGGGGSSGGGPFRNNGGAGGVVSSAMPTSSGAAGTSTTMHSGHIFPKTHSPEKQNVRQEKKPISTTIVSFLTSRC